MKLINIHTGEIVDSKEIIKADWFKKSWKHLYRKLNEIEDNYCIYDYNEYMSILNSDQIESKITKITIPKYSKEQKIVQKALIKIQYFIYSQDVKTKKDTLADLYYACGLLESLLFKDDEEQPCEPSSVK